METTLDDLITDGIGLDDFTSDEDVQEEPKTEDFFSEGQTNNSLIDKLLEAKGFKDNKVTIVEDDTTKVLDFYELSPEEQIEILSADAPKTGTLTTEEQEFLNTLKRNNTSINQFLDQYKQSIINEIQDNSVDSYQIDDYTDEELFLLDLKNKFDLTDDELVQELEKEMQNEDMFKRKVDKLRNEYREAEKQYNASKYEEFEQQMINVALDTPDFYGIELDNEEKDEVLSFLLDTDATGESDFTKALNDPKKLYEAAWFLRYGKESFDLLRNAYEEEINKLKAEDKNKKVIIKENNDDKKTININDLI